MDQTEFAVIEEDDRRFGVDNSQQMFGNLNNKKDSITQTQIDDPKKEKKQTTPNYKRPAKNTLSLSADSSKDDVISNDATSMLNHEAINDFGKSNYTASRRLESSNSQFERTSMISDNILRK